MPKDFQKWHLLKSVIDKDNLSPLFRSQEVWWCSLGANVGVEADGKHQLFQRPVLVFRKFNKEMFWGLPLTSKVKVEKLFYFPITFHDQTQIAILSQMRLLSSKRLIRRLVKLSDSQFKVLNEAMEFFLKQTDPLRGPRVPNGNKYFHTSKPSLKVKRQKK